MDDDPQPQSMLVCKRQRWQCKHSQYQKCKQRWWRYLENGDLRSKCSHVHRNVWGVVFEKNRMMHGQNNSRARIAAQAWIREPLHLTNSTIRLVIRGSALTIIDLHPYISKSLFSWQISCFFSCDSNSKRGQTDTAHNKLQQRKISKPVENHGNSSFHLLSSLHLASLFHSPVTNDSSATVVAGGAATSFQNKF